MYVVRTCRKSTPISRFALQEWIERMSQPKSISVMIARTLSNAWSGDGL